jgi:predicted nucleic acid-binding protein
VAGLVDTNILVYRFDARFPAKQKRATALLRQGILDESLVVPQQALVEFVAVVTRPIFEGRPLLALADPHHFRTQRTYRRIPHALPSGSLSRPRQNLLLNIRRQAQ